MQQTFQQGLKFLDKYLQPQNPYLLGIVTIFLVLYGALAAPKLPKFIADLFDNALFRLFVLFMIAYLSVKNFTVALIVAIVFTLITNFLNEQKISEGFQEQATYSLGQPLVLVPTPQATTPQATTPQSNILITSPSPSPNVVQTTPQVVDIIETLRARGNFTTLLQALDRAGLTQTLKSGQAYTLFAPTDAAFAQLPAGTLQNLLNNPQELARILQLHVVPGRLSSEQVLATTQLPTISGQVINVGALRISTRDIPTRFGTIHVLDNVLIP